MLQFVNCTGSGPDNDDKEKRRTVRAQAMRYYRRTQREEREAGKYFRCNSALSLALKFIEHSAAQMAGVPARESKRAKSTRRGKDKVSPSTSIVPTNRDVLHDGLNQAPSRQPSLRQTRSSAKRKTNHEREEAEAVHHGLLASQRILPIRPNETDRMTGKHRSTEHSERLNFQQEQLDEFLPSAAVLNRMSDFCKTCMRA